VQICLHEEAETMPLSLGSEGTAYTVKRVGGTGAVRQHLNELGFSVGAPVTVMSAFDGNIIVQVKDSRLAIDRAMAARIMV
jgi:ferrous iron transport protein A